MKAKSFKMKRIAVDLFCRLRCSFYFTELIPLLCLHSKFISISSNYLKPYYQQFCETIDIILNRIATPKSGYTP